MDKRQLTDDELDSLLFASLIEEEEAVPARVSISLRNEMENRRSRWIMSWWVPALAGLLQTTAATAAVQMLFPGSWLSLMAVASGMAISASACALWIYSRKMWKEELEC